MGNVKDNFVNSFTGKVEKARITIIDRRGYVVKVKTVQNKRIGEDGKEELFSTYSLFTDNSSSKKLGAEGILAENLKEKKLELQNKFDDKKTRKTYIVGFNPSNLSIHAIGGGRFSKNNFAQGGNTTSDFSAMNPRIQMDFKLYFDAHADRDWVETEAFSVKTEVEAFIAALRDEGTREVEFAWGKMVYTGVMNMVDVTYTMFSTYGKPLRAEMNVTMLCVDEGLSNGMDSTWAKHYEEAFETDMDLRNISKKFQQLRG